MSRCRILHLILLDKFIPPFIDLLNRRANVEGHVFWLRGDLEKYKVSPDKRTVAAEGYSALAGFIKLLRMAYTSEKIILHGLFSNYYLIFLFFQPWLLKKCYWFVWGGDLYVHELGSKNLKWRIKEFVRRAVIGRIGHIVTYVSGDIDNAERWYKWRGTRHECILYTSNIYAGGEVASTPSTVIRIQVGNSADPSNNHLEVLNLLKDCKDQNFCIYMPLAYGDEDYAKVIADQGREMFGSRFVPMHDFMSYDKYLEFLADIDIAIFHHKRQQGMGNIINLLGAGKKVYVRRGTSSEVALQNLGLTTHTLESFSFELDSDVDRRKNARLVREYFSEDNLIRQLYNIFA